MPQLNGFSQFIEELSAIEYDDKKFVPSRVEYAFAGAVIEDAFPFQKLESAYGKEDVWVAAFYNPDIRVDMSFSDGMQAYGIIGVSYLGDRACEPVMVGISLGKNR